MTDINEYKEAIAREWPGCTVLPMSFFPAPVIEVLPEHFDAVNAVHRRLAAERGGLPDGGRGVEEPADEPVKIDARGNTSHD